MAFQLIVADSRNVACGVDGTPRYDFHTFQAASAIGHLGSAER